MTAPASIPVQVPASRLIATLSGFGLLAGVLLVFVHQATQPAIQAHKAERLREAIDEVLRRPDRFEARVVADGELVALSASGDAVPGELVYLGYDAEGGLVGVAAVGAEPGYQDMVRVMFGYDPVAGVLLGMKVLESRETPGLGDKIEKDAHFVGQFSGARPPLVAVSRGRGSGGPGEIDAISGATISSRAVIRTIDRALERLALERLATAVERRESGHSER